MTRLAEISRDERTQARQRLRDPKMRWETPREARDFYARTVADDVLAGSVQSYALYAYAVAARLTRIRAGAR